MRDSSIDRPRPPAYLARARLGGSGGFLCAVLIAVAGCAPTRPETPAPRERVDSAVRAVRDTTRLTGASRIDFTWELNDRGSRIGGRGVARTEPPYHARLDLFTDNGETAARAALVEGDLRVPPGVDRRLVPPAPLLWSALGVFHPGRDAELLGGTVEGNDGVGVRYRLRDGSELVYHLLSGTFRGAEIRRNGHTVEQVRLERGRTERFPVQATYRDLTAFRELKVTTDSVEAVGSFPSEIWNP